jgi:hypothetical protein
MRWLHTTSCFEAPARTAGLTSTRSVHPNDGPAGSPPSAPQPPRPYRPSSAPTVTRPSQALLIGATGDRGVAAHRRSGSEGPMSHRTLAHIPSKECDTKDDRRLSQARARLEARAEALAAQSSGALRSTRGRMTSAPEGVIPDRFAPPIRARGQLDPGAVPNSQPARQARRKLATSAFTDTRRPCGGDPSGSRPRARRMSSGASRRGKARPALQPAGDTDGGARIGDPTCESPRRRRVTP